MNEKINLQELIGLLAEKSDITKKEAEAFFREFFDLMADSLVSEKQIKIKNLGGFKLAEVEDRESVDVRTGERVLIPAHLKIIYSPDKYLSETVNEPFALFEPVEVEEEAEEVQLPLAEEGKVPGEEEKSEENAVVQPEVHAKHSDYQQDKEWDSHLESRRQRTTESRINWQVVVITVIVLIAVGFAGYLILNEDKFDPNGTVHVLPPSVVSKATPELVQKKDSLRELQTSVSDSVPGKVTGAGTIPAKDTVRRTDTNTDTKTIVQKPVVQEPVAVKKEERSNVRKRTIGPGERLTVIALQEYGNKVFWVYLYEENKGIIKNPNNVPAGLEIVVPFVSKYKIDKNNPESVRRAEELEKKYR